MYERRKGERNGENEKKNKTKDQRGEIVTRKEKQTKSKCHFLNSGLVDERCLLITVL